MEKAKASCKISFPVTLDLGQIIARSQCQPPNSAVIDNTGAPSDPAVPHESNLLPSNPSIPSPSTKACNGGSRCKPEGSSGIDGGAGGSCKRGGSSSGAVAGGIPVLKGPLCGAASDSSQAAGGKYNLIAAIIHKGPSASSGHYGEPLDEHITENKPSCVEECYALQYKFYSLFCLSYCLVNP